MNVDEMIFKIRMVTDACDWDDVADMPEEMVTIDNLFEIVRSYRDKYNSMLEKLENRMTDINATIDYYREREELGLD